MEKKIYENKRKMLQAEQNLCCVTWMVGVVMMCGALNLVTSVVGLALIIFGLVGQLALEYKLDKLDREQEKEIDVEELLKKLDAL